MALQPTGRIAIDGGELEFARVPPVRNGLPEIVFLHEGLGSLGLWRDFPAALAARTGCGALAYSRLGNGFSTPLTQPRTPQYMHDEALIVLPALLEAAGIERAVLFGHSDGASIALIFAGERPAAVRGIIVEAPHLFVETLSVDSITAIEGEYRNGRLRDRMAPHHADVDRTFYGWNDIWLAPEFRSWNIEEYAARVRAPVLALQGLDDEYGTPAQLEGIGRFGEGSVDRLLLAHCGHTPHRDRATTVEAACTGWIAEALAT